MQNNDMELTTIPHKIFEIREQKVMLDFDLAELYGTETKILKQSVRRNIDRFPPDFMFELTREEYNSLRSHFVTLKNTRGQHTKYLPFAFTEQGVAMLATVLKSPQAIAMNIAIMRAFIKIRKMTFDYSELQKALEDLETSTNEQFNEVDVQLTQLYAVVTSLCDKQQKEKKERNRIGFIITGKDNK